MFNPLRRLRLAIPDGSMQKVVTGWLEKIGLLITLANSRQKTGTINVPFIESVTFMRPQEIPLYLERGFFDLAIANEDWIANWRSDLNILLKIPVGRATNHAVKIVLAVLRDSGYKSVFDLPENCTVASEYVELTEQYLFEKDRSDIKVIRSYGGTELKPKLSIAAIVDICETGSSLIANGLVIIDELLTSDTVVAANIASYSDPEIRPLIEWFAAVIEGAVKSVNYVLLQANVPDDLSEQACQIIGGMLSPTKNLLVTSGWYELSSYIEKSRQHEIIFRLLQLGVKDICVLDSVSLIMGTQP